MWKRSRASDLSQPLASQPHSSSYPESTDIPLLPLTHTHVQTDEHTWYYHTCTCNYVYTYRCGSRYGNKVTQSCTGCGFTQILAGTHTFLPISSHIYQCGVRDDLERLSVLIISLDSWSAAAVKNETAISWPPVLLIRKRTIPNHRMD